MAQSIFGGATEYGEQSLEDIFEDIGYWIDYSKRIKILLSNGMSDSKKSGFWKKIDNEFQMTIETSICFINTILYDLHEIVRSKENGCITNKEVTLLSNIGRKSIQYNNEYGRNYKAEKRLWHDYGNPDFKVVENMYSKGLHVSKTVILLTLQYQYIDK